MTPYGKRDTIVAIATPAGRGAVGIVRLSGTDTPRIAAALLGVLPPARVASLRVFRDADGSALDTGLAIYFPAPASFTGEPVLEVQGHGGAFVLDRVVQRVLALGARMARPGEFSERAFLNGKMDLAQAEAVADLIDAGSAAAARAAVRSMQGEFSAHIHRLQNELTALRTHVEAAIDFPDEEIDWLPAGAFHEHLARILAGFDAILTAARQGALLREGLNVVIAGRPNVGKSSLLNRLVGDDVAIVTTLPGTTRDVLRHRIHLDGLPVNLSDTAGLRAAADRVEEEGVRRAMTEMQRADRVLYVQDAGQAEQALPAEFEALPPAVPVTWVFNKIDLVGAPPHVEERDGTVRLYLSARTGAGLPLLHAHLKSSVGFQDGESGVFSARRRHLDALHRAQEAVQRAAEALRSARAFELFAEDLRLAQRSLSEVTGEFGSEDLLGAIFGSFCIGK
jgi:tRNA modification GTPase